jgi:GMP synthase-like glutamine amidotransferase
MKIGIVQTGHAPDALIGAHGDYDAMFRRLLGGHGFDFESRAVVDGAMPGSPADADGWLITGSRHGAYDDLPWIPPLEAFIRDAHAAGVPVAGICFGHQIMAQALGGKVEKWPGGWQAGPQSYTFADGETLVLHAWHQDQVTVPPPGATVTASAPGCRYAGFAWPGRGWSIQPHPEFDAAFLRGLIDTRGRGVVPDALLDAARAALGQPTASAAIADRIAAFFRETR